MRPSVTRIIKHECFVSGNSGLVRFHQYKSFDLFV